MGEGKGGRAGKEDKEDKEDKGDTRAEDTVRACAVGMAPVVGKGEAAAAAGRCRCDRSNTGPS